MLTGWQEYPSPPAAEQNTGLKQWLNYLMERVLLKLRLAACWVVTDWAQEARSTTMITKSVKFFIGIIFKHLNWYKNQAHHFFFHS
ncbi:MAG TPA: hypothetical protein DCQ97_04295 [Chitinophagaceae bacterium]|nr:hypothetical protein [Chitinophagaceae bacterium]